MKVQGLLDRRILSPTFYGIQSQYRPIESAFGFRTTFRLRVSGETSLSYH